MPVTQETLGTFETACMLKVYFLCNVHPSIFDNITKIIQKVHNKTLQKLQRLDWKALLYSQCKRSKSKQIGGF